MQNSIIKKGGIENALKETPNDLTKEDWEWLVKEHFTSSNFKKVSSRNSGNRGHLTMPHRTGSMPFRQVIWDDMGGKEGKEPPPISAVFKRTRKRKSGDLDEDEDGKYNEIVDVEKENPSLSHFEVVEKCFGEQDRGSVVCFGFGVTPKDVRGPLPSRAELMARIQEKERENVDLNKKIDEIKEDYGKKMNDMAAQLNMLMEAHIQRTSGRDQAMHNVPGDYAF
ncbi:uncharacterized protein LOC125498432 [Beta vulgaris subsp. vulgaris]|nr:uncharacterized protein LOC125498432 [Beta vulgaris subsp. vulgaris]